METTNPQTSDEATEPTEASPPPLTHKEAASNLVRALSAKGMTATPDGKRMAVTAHLNGASQMVVLRGEPEDMRWCMIWEPFRTEDAPEIEPILPIGQEWVLAGRLLGVLELAQIQV